MESEDALIRADVFFGHISLETRMRRDGNKLIGEGRKRVYDGDGKLCSDHYGN